MVRWGRGGSGRGGKIDLAQVKDIATWIRSKEEYDPEQGNMIRVKDAKARYKPQIMNDPAQIKEIKELNKKLPPG